MSDSIYVRLGVPTSRRSQDGPSGHLGFIKGVLIWQSAQLGPLRTQDGTSRPLRAPRGTASGQVRTPRSGPSPGSSDVDQPDRCMPVVAQGKKGTMLAGSLGCAWVRRFAASDGRRRAGLPRHIASPRCLSTLFFPLGQLITRISDMSTVLSLHKGSRAKTANWHAHLQVRPRIHGLALRQAGRLAMMVTKAARATS